jgi:hypothetical protein
VAWFRDLASRIDSIMNAIDHAKQIGTYGKPDRSPQYPLITQKQIVDAVNLALTKVRIVENDKATKLDLAALRKQVESRIWHRIVVIVAAAEFSLIVMLLEKYAK